MTSLVNWKRSLLSISALFFFAYLVSSAPFFSSQHQQVQQEPQARQRSGSGFPKTPSRMTIRPSADLDVTLSPASSSESSLQFQKESSSSTKYSLPFHLTVTNKADHSISVLTWNSPLDPKASHLGVFHVYSGDEEIPLQTLKFNRKLPPPVEDVVEIPSGGKVEREVEIKGVELGEDSQAKSADGYKVRAEGRWQAVWRGGVDEVISESRLEGVKPSGNAGSFKSNDVDVTVA